MINWLEIIEQNEEKIIDALKKAYKNAAGTKSNTGWEECVDIDKNGIVSVYTIGNNSVSIDVWKGDAIQIARFPWFNVLDGIENEDIIEFLEYENQIDDFVNYLIQEDYITEEEKKYEYNIFKNARLLENWNKELWDKYISEVVDWLMGDFDPDIYIEESKLWAKEYIYEQENKV